MGKRAIALAICLLTTACTMKEPEGPPIVPPPEDLSTWSVPEIVQSAQPEPPAEAVKKKERPASKFEKVFEFVPGHTYQLTVGLDAWLDVVLEPGEQVRNTYASDPKPIPQGEEGKQQGRWDIKEGFDGLGDTLSPHLFIRAFEPGATTGITITTTKRIYYLTAKSVQQSPIRAIRWKYEPEPVIATIHTPVESPMLPDPFQTRLFHVGYHVSASQPNIAWIPRSIVDDGKKLYIVYPEITLWGTVPIVRAVGPNGPQLVNARQFLNVVILDVLAGKIELRVGTGDKAETVIITRQQLRTIECPGTSECPVWPKAAHALRGGNS